MAITPVSASNNAVSATQSIKPEQAVEAMQRAAKESKATEKKVDAPPQAPPPKPSVNAQGQSIGTRINVTA